MGRRRFAVALLLPDRLGAEVDGLRRALGDDLTKIVPHVTLVPPVDVREDDVAAAAALVREVATQVPPFDLVLGPVTTFLPVTPVAYLEVAGAVEHVRRLRELLLVAPLARRSAHEFVPHVTIGDGIEPARIEAAVAALTQFEARWPVRSVTLLEHGAPGPHRWNPVADPILTGQ